MDVPEDAVGALSASCCRTPVWLSTSRTLNHPTRTGRDVFVSLPGDIPLCLTLNLDGDVRVLRGTVCWRRP